LLALRLSAAHATKLHAPCGVTDTLLKLSHRGGTRVRG
jgi:hypothetical protein